MNNWSLYIIAAPKVGRAMPMLWREKTLRDSMESNLICATKAIRFAANSQKIWHLLPIIL